MQTSVRIRRAIGLLGVIAITMGWIALVAAPPAAASGPTATLARRTVTISGTPVRDVVAIALDTDGIRVDFGSNGSTEAQFGRSRFDRVVVRADDGDDAVAVEGVGVGDVPITMRGQAGNDFLGVAGDIGTFGEGDAAVTMIGSGGNDDFLAATPGPTAIRAGAGNDSVTGGHAGTGRATIALGEGDDQLVSSLGDLAGGSQNHIVDGGAGRDALDLQGTFATEGVSLSADAGHLIVDHDSRDRIDADNVEDVSWLGFGGLDESGSGDAVAVNDLSTTDVVRFAPDFTDPLDGAGPNNSSDTLTVRGTAAVDHIAVSNSGTDITVAGLIPLVTAASLASDDFLLIQTGDGRDIVDSSGLQRGLVQLVVQ